MNGRHLVAVPQGREHLAPRSFIRRHRHLAGYVAVVLEGSYVESGDEGRRRVEAGDVLVHAGFEAHQDIIGARGARVLNLPLPSAKCLPVAFVSRDPDLVARVAETDPQLAADLLGEGRSDRSPAQIRTWPDDLAELLRRCGRVALGAWAEERGLAPATVTRAFHAAYGVAPARYRVEARVRRALRDLSSGKCRPLAELALDHGFADQAHFCRAVREVTGAAPSAWVGRSDLFKTSTQPAP